MRTELDVCKTKMKTVQFENSKLQQMSDLLKNEIVRLTERGESVALSESALKNMNVIFLKTNKF